MEGSSVLEMSSVSSKLLRLMLSDCSARAARFSKGSVCLIGARGFGTGALASKLISIGISGLGTGPGMVVLSVPSETGELALSTLGFGVGVSWLVVVNALVTTVGSVSVLLSDSFDGGTGVVSVSLEFGISPPVSTKQ